MIRVGIVSSRGYLLSGGHANARTFNAVVATNRRGASGEETDTCTHTRKKTYLNYGRSGNKSLPFASPVTICRLQQLIFET